MTADKLTDIATIADPKASRIDNKDDNSHSEASLSLSFRSGMDPNFCSDIAPTSIEQA